MIHKQQNTTSVGLLSTSGVIEPHSVDRYRPTAYLHFVPTLAVAPRILGGLLVTDRFESDAIQVHFDAHFDIIQVLPGVIKLKQLAIAIALETFDLSILPISLLLGRSPILRLFDAQSLIFCRKLRTHIGAVWDFVQHYNTQLQS